MPSLLPFFVSANSLYGKQTNKTNFPACFCAREGRGGRTRSLHPRFVAGGSQRTTRGSVSIFHSRSRPFMRKKCEISPMDSLCWSYHVLIFPTSAYPTAAPFPPRGKKKPPGAYSHHSSYQARTKVSDGQPNSPAEITTRITHAWQTCKRPSSLAVAPTRKEKKTRTQISSGKHASVGRKKSPNSRCSPLAEERIIM